MTRWWPSSGSRRGQGRPDPPAETGWVGRGVKPAAAADGGGFELNLASRISGWVQVAGCRVQ